MKGKGLKQQLLETSQKPHETEEGLLEDVLEFEMFCFLSKMCLEAAKEGKSSTDYIIGRYETQIEGKFSSKYERYLTYMDLFRFAKANDLEIATSSYESDVFGIPRYHYAIAWKKEE